MNAAPKFTPELRAELEAWEERALSPEEFASRVNAPWTEQECEDFDGLVRWFNRRYPTPADRLRATRQLLDQLPGTRRSD